MSWWWEQNQALTCDARAGVSVLCFALMPAQRKALHQRIDQRFEQMLAQGFVAEVQRLRDRGDLSLALPSMRAVGYRQVWQHLDGDYGLAELQAKATAATRQLAKRQLTWLRSWPEYVALEPGADRTNVAQIVSAIRGV